MCLLTVPMTSMSPPLPKANNLLIPPHLEKFPRSRIPLRHQRLILMFLTGAICDILRNLVTFVQFKKREKRPCRSVTFSKVVGF